MTDDRRWNDRPDDWRRERDQARDRRRDDQSLRPGDNFADYRDWRATGWEGGGSRAGGSRGGRWWNDERDYSQRDWHGGEDRYGRERYSSPYGEEPPMATSWRDARNEAGRGRWEDEWRPDYGGRPAPRPLGGSERWERDREGWSQERPPRERSSFGGHEPARGPDQGRGHAPGERGWMDQARDEVASWFGDHDAEARRDRDRAMQGEHRGRGPSGYRRSDERIREDVHDRLTDDSWLDATGIEVQVQGGEVTLTGLVHDRSDKRRAENLAERVLGVMHVQNLLRVKAPHGVMHTAGSEQSDDAAAGVADHPSAAGPSGGAADSQRTTFGSAATGASTAGGRGRV